MITPQKRPLIDLPDDVSAGEAVPVFRSRRGGVGSVSIAPAADANAFDESYSAFCAGVIVCGAGAGLTVVALVFLRWWL